jgi:5,10-methylenetetrahydrofolate reductase
MIRTHPAGVVWEIDAPSDGGPRELATQLDAIREVAWTVLVPDNPAGRPTVSSIAVARRVKAAGQRPMACLNARDRNLLGFRRDLLTCEFEGIDDVLLVYGDEPAVGARSFDLTVRLMLDECRARAPDLHVGVTTRLARVPRWKLAADSLFVQVGYDLEALRSWRDTVTFDGPVIPAVMVVPSLSMAKRLSARVPELQVPDAWLAAIAVRPDAGAELAIDLAEQILASGEFEGVHIVGGRSYRPAAARLRLTTSPSPSPVAVRSHHRSRTMAASGLTAGSRDP